MERDWANLEALPLGLILDKLEEKIDHVWFSVVCKNWQLIAKLNHQNHQFKMNTIPMLMVSPKSLCLEINDSFTSLTTQKKNGLFGIPNKRLYPFQYRLGLIKPKFHFRGSSHSWVAVVNDSISTITLINPFKDISSIILPSLNRICKVTLSADPITNPNDYVVAAIYDNGCNLAFIRSGQKNWTYVETMEPLFIDVIFCKGVLFALNIRRKIVSIKICGSDKKVTPNVILQEKVDEGIFQDKFLVKSLNEELWMVRRCTLRRNIYHVYKLKLDAKSEKLEEMCKLKSLGDNILFLGKGDSISVSASYFSKSLQRDSIYFADYLKIYNMKNQKSISDGLYGKYTFWILPYFQWD